MTAYGAALGINLVSARIRARYPEWTLIPWGAFMSADRFAAAGTAAAEDPANDPATYTP